MWVRRENEKGGLKEWQQCEYVSQSEKYVLLKTDFKNQFGAVCYEIGSTLL